MLRCLYLRKCRKRLLLPLVHRVPCARIIAGVGSIGSHAMPGGDHHNSGLVSLAFRLFSPEINEGGTGYERIFFTAMSFPSESISRARMLCLNANGLSSSRLSDKAREVPHDSEAADARTDGLEPLPLSKTARCAFRGIWHTLGDSARLLTVI